MKVKTKTTKEGYKKRIEEYKNVLSLIEQNRCLERL